MADTYYFKLSDYGYFSCVASARLGHDLYLFFDKDATIVLRDSLILMPADGTLSSFFSTELD